MAAAVTKHGAFAAHLASSHKIASKNVTIDGRSDVDATIPLHAMQGGDQAISFTVNDIGQAQSIRRNRGLSDIFSSIGELPKANSQQLKRIYRHGGESVDV
jgi:hypothetical protein